MATTTTSTTSTTAAPDSKVKWFILILGIVIIILCSLLFTGLPSSTARSGMAEDETAPASARASTPRFGPGVTNYVYAGTTPSEIIPLMGYQLTIHPRYAGFWWRVIPDGKLDKASLPLEPIDYPGVRRYVLPYASKHIQVQVVAGPGQQLPAQADKVLFEYWYEIPHPLPYRERSS